MSSRFLVTMMAMLLSSVCYSQHTSKIDNLKGEKWWGAYVSMGAKMPYLEKVSGDLAYDNKGNQSVPLFVSSQGRYIWSDKPFRFEIDNDQVVIVSDFEEVKPISAGKTLREAYLTACQRHFQPTGITPNEMMFTMPQYNTWIELMYDQTQKGVLEYAENIEKNRFPKGVIMIDDGWQQYYGSLSFNGANFPNPKEMVQYLHDRGFKVMLWVSPFVSPDSPEYRDLAKKGFLIKRKGVGKPALIEWWNGFSACYDLTNPGAFNYVYSKLKTLQDEYGIDGFKFDAGDTYFYTGDIESFDANAMAVDHLTRWADLGLKFDYNEFRAAWKKGGEALAQRLCDKDYDWASLKRLIPDMIAAGLMGYPYTCPDLIGGGEFSSFLDKDRSSLDQNLIVRSAQVHAMMPMMQFSIAPWNILDQTNLEYCRQAALLHEKMSQYIYSLAKEASQTGAPIIRAMEYEFPNKGFSDCNDQFMLGTKYLVAPVIDKSNSRDVRLPAGRWIDDQGKKYKGPLVLPIKVDDGRLPYFERQGGNGGVLSGIKNLFK